LSIESGIGGYMILDCLKRGNPREVLKTFNSLSPKQRKGLLTSLGLNIRKADMRQIIKEGAKWQDEKAVDYAKFRRPSHTNASREAFDKLFN
jgi:hypothetical protein